MDTGVSINTEIKTYIEKTFASSKDLSGSAATLENSDAGLLLKNTAFGKISASARDDTDDGNPVRPSYSPQMEMMYFVMTPKNVAWLK